MNKDFSLKDWQKLPLGGVIVDGGNSIYYETGTWRAWKPILKPENCINCLTCWVFCPEDAFHLKEGKNRREIDSINYFHCKGCGICVKECPVNKKGDKVALDFIKEEM